MVLLAYEDCQPLAPIGIVKFPIHLEWSRQLSQLPGESSLRNREGFGFKFKAHAEASVIRIGMLIRFQNIGSTIGKEARNGCNDPAAVRAPD